MPETIYDLLGMDPPAKGPPEMEALMSAANDALGKLVKLMQASSEPHMDANATLVWEAWATLELVNLVGPPHGKPSHG